MKMITKILLVASIMLLSIGGCKSEKIQVIHNDKVVTNTVPVKAFNDESYIWEGWSFSTNQVNSIEQ